MRLPHNRLQGPALGLAPLQLARQAYFLSHSKSLTGHKTLHSSALLISSAGPIAGRAALTDNFDACRDLSGRRMRHVNADKKLADWAAHARDRELQKAAANNLREQERAAQQEVEQQVRLLPPSPHCVACSRWASKHVREPEGAAQQKAEHQGPWGY